VSNPHDVIKMYYQVTETYITGLPAVELYLAGWRYGGEDFSDSLRHRTNGLRGDLFKYNERCWRVRYYIEDSLAILSKHGEDELGKALRLFSVDHEDPENDAEIDEYWRTSKRRDAQNEASNS
jgi:hypothetical protein